MNILVTGGSGFIGSNLINLILRSSDHKVFNIDKLSYASNEDFNSSSDDNYNFYNIDLCDRESLKRIISSIDPEIVYHLAAETHVDNSIASPDEFIRSNIIGTFNLLETLRENNSEASGRLKKIIHISTDEVFGDNDQYVNEEDRYEPSSPYSASKASSDHLVTAWGRTFSLPVIVTNCSNNFGPNQNKEKFLPKVIISFIKELKIPVYGNGQQSRDWLFVEDHVRALKLIGEKGTIGEKYNISSMINHTNLEMIGLIEKVLNEIHPSIYPKKEDLITHVEDRFGHDVSYKLDSSKIKKELNWLPNTNIEKNLNSTINWYLKNLNRLT